MKPFAIYCSQGANTLQSIYGHSLNLEKVPPSLVLYDGNQPQVISKLEALFGSIVEVFDPTVFAPSLQKKPHTMVSLFLEQRLKMHKIEHLICIGEKILKKQLIQAMPAGILNFHPALLPAFKGLRAIDQALETDVTFLGTTAHYIDEGIDTGKIVAQAAMYREEFEDYPDVLELTGPLLKLVLRDWAQIPLTREEITHELQNRQKAYFLPQKCRL